MTRPCSSPPPQVKRVYDDPAPDDGTRVLVDRVWPRGLRKDEAHLDEWLKGVAPSTELRKWFGHRPERYDEFAERYARELAQGEPAAAFTHLRELADSESHTPLTLLTATKQWQISQAAVLAHLLSDPPKRAKNGKGQSS